MGCGWGTVVNHNQEFKGSNLAGYRASLFFYPLGKISLHQSSRKCNNTDYPWKMNPQECIVWRNLLLKAFICLATICLHIDIENYAKILLHGSFFWSFVPSPKYLRKPLYASDVWWAKNLKQAQRGQSTKSSSDNHLALGNGPEMIKCCGWQLFLSPQVRLS